MGYPQIIIDGHWLSALTPWGDLEWSTVWPGGSDALTFGVSRTHKTMRPDAIVELYWGAEPLWCGTLLDPTRGEPLVAEGLFRKGEDYTALNPAGNVSTAVNEAVDYAVERGLPWQFYDNGPFDDLSPQPGVSGTPALQLDQPHSVAQYLDASAQQRGHQWGIDPYRRVRMHGWPTTPAFHMLPGVNGLGISRDGYASVLVGRYLDSGTNAFHTVVSEDAAAIRRWGRVERTITQPLGEGQPMAMALAQALIDGLIAQGRSQIGWTSALEVQHGDVAGGRGQAVDLATITAGQTIRLHGLEDDMADLDGRTWTDVRIARVTHKDGVTTIEPQGLVTPMNDVLAGVAS